MRPTTVSYSSKEKTPAEPQKQAPEQSQHLKTAVPKQDFCLMPGHSGPISYGQYTDNAMHRISVDKNAAKVKKLVSRHTHEMDSIERRFSINPCQRT